MWNVPASLCSIVPLKACGPPALLIAQVAGEFKMRDRSLFADRQSEVPWACMAKHTAVNLLRNFVLMIYSGGGIEVCVTKLPAWKNKRKVVKSERKSRVMCYIKVAQDLFQETSLNPVERMKGEDSCVSQERALKLFCPSVIIEEGSLY